MAMGLAGGNAGVGEVLVGYGHEPAGRRALDVAADLAVRLGVRLRVVHVVDAGDHPVDPDSPTFEADAEHTVAERRDAVDARLRDVADRRGVPIDRVHEIRRGEPVRELSRVADEHDATMIVVGTRGEGVGPILSRLVEPSVSHGLIHRQSRPVLVVPER